MKLTLHTISLAALATVLLLGGDAHARGRRELARQQPAPQKTDSLLQCDIDAEGPTVCYRCSSESQRPERDQNCRLVDA